MLGALEGIKVLDVSQFIAGASCSAILGGMGADVIKVESPMGDTMRLLLQAIDPDFEPIFCTLNSNKRGITLNFKKERAVEIFKKLCEKSDVVVENLAPGTMENFGLGYDDLSKLNPRLIYTSITGYGKTGPHKDRTSFDLIAQATGGLIPIMKMIGNKPFELKKDEQLWARGMFSEIEYRKRKYLIPGIVTRLSGSPGAVTKGAPELGQHNEEIFSSLGYSKAEIEEFKKNGIC